MMIHKDEEEEITMMMANVYLLEVGKMEIDLVVVMLVEEMGQVDHSRGIEMEEYEDTTDMIWILISQAEIENIETMIDQTQVGNTKMRIKEVIMMNGTEEGNAILETTNLLILIDLHLHQLQWTMERRRNGSA
jgi:hypothetical protein